MAAKARPLFDPAIVLPAIVESFKKLNPIHMVKNPVMFVTEVGAALTTAVADDPAVTVRADEEALKP